MNPNEHMEHKLRGAVVGCGARSDSHLRAWQRINEVEIEALVDPALDQAERRRAAFAPEARVYADLDPAIEYENLDFVDILTPPALHLEQCMAARAAGLHILCRPPLCGNLADARRVVTAMSEYSHVFAVSENHRRLPWFEKIRRWYCSGKVGTVALVRFEHVRGEGPTSLRGNEAGVWLARGSELVDMMRSLLGEPSGVYARMHQVNQWIVGESLVHAVYEYPTITAAIDVAWRHGAVAKAMFALAGDAGDAVYEGSQETARLLLTGNAGVSDEACSPDAEYAESLYALLHETTDAMLGHGPVTQSGPEHLRTLECTFAAYRSAAEGLPVSL